MLQLTYTRDEIASYTANQLNTLFPDKKAVSTAYLAQYVDETLNRLSQCFRRIALSTYCDDSGPRFDVLHSDQYCSYLYLFANTIHRAGGDKNVATKLFYLNKSLHAFNCMYDVELPSIFLLIHVVGTVIGKASYSDYLVVRQNCTIGAIAGVYPTFGEKVILSAAASVIGKCCIGDNVMIGPGCIIFQKDVPSETLVTVGGHFQQRRIPARAIATHFHI